MKKYKHINNNNIDRWKEDTRKSVVYYNDWFMKFAPCAYKESRKKAIEKVENVFQMTDCLRNISTTILREHPESIAILRMATMPPLARERVAGLSGTSKSIIQRMEEGKITSKTGEKELKQILYVIKKLFDTDIMPWLKNQSYNINADRYLASSIIADRLCGSLTDPLIRNEQEHRQLESISNFLNQNGYTYIEAAKIRDFLSIPAGHFTFHLNIAAKINETGNVNIPIDVAIMRKESKKNEFPILVECKSAGDFTNTNKRRKEEATKIEQLKYTYGNNIDFILFLCGYFDSGYLGYEAAEGIDWIWEHRIEDFHKTGI